jgi:hypothetical protein
MSIKVKATLALVEWIFYYLDQRSVGVERFGLSKPSLSLRLLRNTDGRLGEQVQGHSN